MLTQEIYVETQDYDSLTAGCCEAIKIQSYQLRVQHQIGILPIYSKTSTIIEIVFRSYCIDDKAAK